MKESRPLWRPYTRKVATRPPPTILSRRIRIHTAISWIRNTDSNCVYITDWPMKESRPLWRPDTRQVTTRPLTGFNCLYITDWPMKESRPLWRPDTRQVTTRPLTGFNCLYITDRPMKESRPLWRPDTRQVATRPLTGSNCLYCI